MIMADVLAVTEGAYPLQPLTLFDFEVDAIFTRLVFFDVSVPNFRANN